MRRIYLQSVCAAGLLLLVCTVGAARAVGAGFMVSDASATATDKGDLLAFVYNHTDDHRLVVIDETNRRRYESPLRRAGYPPFWDDGKVYVINTYGEMQGFRVSPEGLVAEKQETVSAGGVRSPEYDRRQRRLYLIRDYEDPNHRQTVVHDIVAIDFQARKLLWTKRIDEGGLVRVFEPYVCVTGQKLVQVFKCETGEKIAVVEAAKATVSAGADAHK